MRYEEVPYGWDTDKSVARFSSLSDMAETAKRLVETEAPNRGTPHFMGNKPEFTGATFEEVHSFALQGWTEGARKADDLAGEIVTKVDEHVRRAPGARKTGMVGKRVRTGRYAAGNPRCLVRRPKQPVPSRGRVVHLHVGMAFIADVPREVVIRRGAAILGLGITLAKRGYRLRVTSEATSSSGARKRAGHSASRRDYSILVDLQSPDKPLDPGTLALALAHPGYFRHLGFAIRSVTKWWMGSGGEGATKERNAFVPEGAINLDPAFPGDPVAADPVAWILDVLAQVEKR